MGYFWGITGIHIKVAGIESKITKCCCCAFQDVHTLPVPTDIIQFYPIPMP